MSDSRTELTRKDYQFLKLCIEAASIFSTCAKRQYATYLTDERNDVVATGYNGPSRGLKHCTDGGCPRFFENSNAGSSYDNCISCHSEQNALISATRGFYTLYVNGSPCYTCAKMISNTTCKRVVHTYDPDYPYQTDELVEQLFMDVGIVQLRITEEELINASS